MDIFSDLRAVDPVILVIVGGVALLAAVVFLLLWLFAARGHRAERRARIELERELDDADLDLSEQSARMRMVRELHEVAILSVTGIIRQAEGARFKGEADPAAAVRAAGAIAEAGRTTVADLRRVMAVVRQGEAEVAPKPAMKNARELFRLMRDAGLDVRFEETGNRFSLKQGAEVAIYRILQESLSNALKYGGEGTEVKVTFRWSDAGLNVLVDDDGIRATTRRAGGDPNEISRMGGYTVDDDAAALTASLQGPGMTEMKERTELFGGVFNAYSVPGVGFSISVAFPNLRFDNGVHGVDLRRV